MGSGSGAGSFLKVVANNFDVLAGMDGKYVLTGGEDDLVQVWSMEDRKVVAWGEGHNSWVSGVAFDSYWSSPNSNGSEENVMYRFGSVGQDTTRNCFCGT
ncbi:hypothetical protein ACSBR1_020337 [Camellia fascicularis]